MSHRSRFNIGRGLLSNPGEQIVAEDLIRGVELSTEQLEGIDALLDRLVMQVGHGSADELAEALRAELHLGHH